MFALYNIRMCKVRKKKNVQMQMVRMLNPRTDGGAVIRPPPLPPEFFFPDSVKTAARSAAKFA